jgi:rhodanese-related sulfurtransferase
LKKGDLMDPLEYFKARLEATIGAVEVMEALQSNPESICIVDVRNGPAAMLKDRIKGALQIPQENILKRIGELPKNRTLILYCWDTNCNLAAKAAVVLLERGFEVKELCGGSRAWRLMRFPEEPVDATALEGSLNPLDRFKA